MLPIFTIVINFALFLVFFRFLTQLAQIDRFNPVIIALNKATLVIDLLSKSIPTVAKGRVNLACIVILVILYLVKIAGIAQLSGEPLYNPLHLAVLTFVTMIQNLITFCRYLIFGAIIGSLIMALTQNSSPFFQVLDELAEPILAPFRKIMPNMGMFDLSPMLAILVLILAENIMEMVAKVLLAGF